eukprot:Hpha_TRINITY_DN11798_c0_g2::TRINITY_DN11798_c0_g2_i1::g.31869::m.31869
MGCSASVPTVANSSGNLGKAPQAGLRHHLRRTTERSEERGGSNTGSSADVPYEDQQDPSLQKSPQRGLPQGVVEAVTRRVQLTAASLEQEHLTLSPPLGGGSVVKQRRLQDECALCLADFKCGDELRVLRCYHHFHAACVDDWLQHWGTTCPLCCRRVCPTLHSESSSATSQM